MSDIDRAESVLSAPQPENERAESVLSAPQPENERAESVLTASRRVGDVPPSGGTASQPVRDVSRPVSSSQPVSHNSRTSRPASSTPRVHVNPPTQLVLDSDPLDEWEMFKRQYSVYSILTEIHKQK